MQHTSDSSRAQQERADYIKLKLAVAGGLSGGDDVFARLSVPYEVVAHLKERVRLSYGRHSPNDRRAQAFLDRYFADLSLERPITLPGLGQTFILDRAGMARELSLPEDGDHFQSDILESYRLGNGQGVLHNPKSDRRTTQGVFHVAEGGAAVPDDKTAVPKLAFARLLEEALRPPRALLTLPFTARAERPAETFVSLLLRPVVVPEVPGVTPRKTTEVRFLVPGTLVSNLDFVERIFGNAGDPHLPENDAGSDIEGWTGHTGYVILAPHLPTLTKKAVGLPHWDDATERQRRDGQCWRTEDERYNGGNAFKITARDHAGVMVTLIADNYYGYCKKEVKTQISFAANLLGSVEEEHAGGAMVHPQYDLGKLFSVATHLPKSGHTFEKVKRLLGDRMQLQKEGYGVDARYPDICYVPENVEINLNTQAVTWRNLSGRQSLPLDPAITYVVPSGFKVRLEKEADSGQWRLIGTTAEGTLLHKPSTVSGGGKSEISKSVSDSIMYGPFFVADFEKDMDAVGTLLDHDYGNRFRDGQYHESRPILSPQRSLGSVIKLLTPSSTLYNDEYNQWLDGIPHSIRELVYVVKRSYQPEMGENWRAHFSVDVVNGRPGNALKFDGERLVAHSMRVGFTEDGSWRTFSLRNDFVPAEKRQAEDDISASLVVPTARLENTNPRYDAQPSVKFVENAERRFFQRPDEAIHRGYDKFTEAHFARPDNFFSNYQPLTPAEARALLAAPISFAAFTPPMQEVVRRAAEGDGYFVSSAHPRIVDGKPTKNPRYLQTRSDLTDARPGYLGEAGMRLHRQVSWDQPLYAPVNATLPGRRLNPPDAAARIRSLAVYNPIHYQETPELFMELISSLTGRSPSTTGAGSEGALTKGPFNALPPIIDLNNALVAHILTGTECFVTAAGYVGPHFRVDHDISLLVPEVWARMEVHERDPRYLIENNFLERLEDFEHQGKTVLASRLGWRITAHFVRTFFGIVFDNPNDLFSKEMLRPELQDLESFVDGVDNIVTAQRLVAEHYFRDSGVDLACPPLRALLHIMRDGRFEGADINDPAIRGLFTYDALTESDWYQERLRTQQALDVRAWTRHIAYLEELLRDTGPLGEAQRRDIAARFQKAHTALERAQGPEYVASLHGFLGADPSVLPCKHCP
ncbi:MAG: hypothetical protein JO250_16670 [Armatimonadetes bacterium]|nr:hypothetical protein [Armatimonadota bacterium]